MKTNRNLLPWIQTTLRWVHALDQGEFIEASGWTKEYLSLDGQISCDNLDLIVKSVNALLETIGSKRRIVWNMGEIVSYVLPS